jgi:hypothetical protein
LLNFRIAYSPPPPLGDIKGLSKGKLDVRVGNRAKVVATAVGTFHLPVPLGLILELNNCYYIHALCKNIIFSSRLEGS